MPNTSATQVAAILRRVMFLGTLVLGADLFLLLRHAEIHREVFFALPAAHGFGMFLPALPLVAVFFLGYTPSTPSEDAAAPEDRMGGSAYQPRAPVRLGDMGMT